MHIFLLRIYRKSTFIRNIHQQVQNPVTAQVAASKVGRSVLAGRNIPFEWQINLAARLVYSSRVLTSNLWTCNIPQPSARSPDELFTLALSHFSDFMSLSPSVCVSVSHWLTDLLSLIFFVFDNQLYSGYLPPSQHSYCGSSTLTLQSPTETWHPCIICCWRWWTDSEDFRLFALRILLFNVLLFK